MPGTFPVDEGGEDALAFGMVLVRRPVLQQDPIAGRCRSGRTERRRRTGRRGRRATAAEPCSTADWALSSEDSAFALRLASRTGLSSERSLPSWERVQVPVSPVDAAAPRLALDEPEALLGQDEQIDLVDGPVARSGTRNWPTPGTDRGRADPFG